MNNNVNSSFKWNDNWWENAFNSAMKSFSGKNPEGIKRERKNSSTSTTKNTNSNNTFKIMEKKIAKKKKKTF